MPNLPISPVHLLHALRAVQALINIDIIITVNIAVLTQSFYVIHSYGYFLVESQSRDVREVNSDTQRHTNARNRALSACTFPKYLLQIQDILVNKPYQAFVAPRLSPIGS